MKKLLVVTTSADKSIDLISVPWMERLVLDYGIDHDRFEKCVRDFNPDLGYLRDPFNTLDYSINNIKTKFQICKQETSRLIDGIDLFDDILIKDKWIQYKLLGEFMPMSFLFDASAVFDEKKYFYKPRISSRARGILFTNEPIKDGSYIMQEKLYIKEEYRVYIICKTILPKVAIRSSKTPSRRVFQKSVRDLSKIAGLQQFLENIIPLIKYDFVGIDVALIEGVIYKLIEINRSPQFQSYHRHTNINPASKMLVNYRS